MKVCNTCLKELHYETEYFTLEDDYNDFVSIRSKLLFCVPEMNLDVFKHSVICIPCSDVLNLAYDFKNNCLRSEQKVRDCQQLINNETSDVVCEEEDFKIDIKQLNLEESCVPIANKETSVLMNLSDVDCEEGDSKIDIKETDLDESYVPFEDIVINKDLPFTILISSNSETNTSLQEHKNDNSINSQSFVTPTKIQVRCGSPQPNVHRANATKNKFQCEACEKKFSHMNFLKRHMLSHLNTKQFQCNICEKSFKKKQYLKNHIVTHTDGKPLCCNVCRKGFRDKKSLRYHTMSHTGEKPHTCNICQKSFIEKRSLDYHTMTHTGEKPFCCNICQKRFIGKANFKRHMIVHTDEKPFCCYICQKSFRHKAYLTYHITMVHKT